MPNNVLNTTTVLSAGAAAWYIASIACMQLPLHDDDQIAGCAAVAAGGGRRDNRCVRTLGTALSGSSTPPADLVGAVIFSMRTRSSRGTSRRAAIVWAVLLVRARTVRA